MLGGYKIIDLTGMPIELGNEAVTISNANVLKQLLSLREYIEDSYDYTHPLNKKLKPILLRLRDEEENEEIEASVWANLSIIDDNLSFKIEGIVNGKTITIDVIFEKVQEADGSDYYAIDSAEYLYTSETQIFEEITDKDGHKRFIEGEIKLLNTVPSSVTKDYGKWSLSGTHLLIVLAVTIDDASTITGALSKLDLPDWIVDKIVPLAGNNVIYKPGQYAMADDSSVQQITHMLTKLSAGIYIYTGSLTTTAVRHTRIQFDLLIDNE